ncbi:YidC/Oxa1 family membrane protein insertase [Patescibacteria group bacterium]
MTIYMEVLYKPLFNALVFLYNLIPWEYVAVGLAIILLTLLIKSLLYSMSAKSIIAQREMQKMQPKMNEIKEKYKNDKEKQSKEMMKFYKENKINPFSSCLPLLIQLPILIALYRVFQHGLVDPNELTTNLYPFVHNPGMIQTNFLGLFDLAVPNLFLAIVAGVVQFFQTWTLLKLKTKKEIEEDAERKKLAKKKKKADFADTASNMTKQMMYVMPIITVFIAMSLPSGLAFYWIATSAFAIFQQWLILKKKQKLEQEEELAERAKPKKQLKAKAK